MIHIYNGLNKQQFATYLHFGSLNVAISQQMNLSALDEQIDTFCNFRVCFVIEMQQYFKLTSSSMLVLVGFRQKKSHQVKLLFEDNGFKK